MGSSTEPQPDAEMVYIVHPDMPDALGGPVTRKALRLIHARKGWKEATAEQVGHLEPGAQTPATTVPGWTPAPIAPTTPTHE